MWSGVMSGFNVKPNSNIVCSLPIKGSNHKRHKRHKKHMKIICFVLLVPLVVTFLFLNQVSVRFGTAVAEELPNLAHFLDLVEIQIRNDNFLFVARSLGDNFSARRPAITLAVEITDIPGALPAHPIDCPDEVSVGDGVRGLLELPEVFAQTCNRR